MSMTVRDATPEDAEELAKLIRIGQEHYQAQIEKYPTAAVLRAKLSIGGSGGSSPRGDHRSETTKKSLWSRISSWFR
jgi:hypothetical protein